MNEGKYEISKRSNWQLTVINSSFTFIFIKILGNFNVTLKAIQTQHVLVVKVSLGDRSTLQIRYVVSNTLSAQQNFRHNGYKGYVRGDN